MIQHFRHKGLERFFTTGSTAGIQPLHASRLRLILSVLHQAVQIRDIDLPGLRLHPLKGRRKGQWAVALSGNWRVIFCFTDGEITDVDLIDYH